MDDRWLWDRSGPADPEVERLESLLGRFRGERRPLPKTGRRRARLVPWLAAAAVAAAAGAVWIAQSAAPRWRVESVEGSPRVAANPVAGQAPFPVGQEIETDAASRARIGIGRIAEISVGPGSRVRLIRSGPVEQRLALDRGSISARIFAPPRLFSVETPWALAVDLGCAYTLDVDPAGAGILRVELGWVSFERGGRESIVPAAAACATRPEKGPGTPYFEDAAPELVRALERYDFENGGEEALTVILAAARRHDGLTLWHLLFRAGGHERELVYERLAILVPPPPGVTREGALAGDSGMLERWRFELVGVPMLPREDSLLWRLRRVWFSLKPGG